MGSELLTTAKRMADLLVTDSDPPSLAIPNEFIADGEEHVFIKAYADLARAIAESEGCLHKPDQGTT